MMLMHHLYCSADRFVGYEISFAPFSQSFVVNFALALKICVSIFAFISGYGLMSSFTNLQASEQSSVREEKNSTSKWVLTHVVKLVAPFLFIYILCFVATLIIDGRPLDIYFAGSRFAGLVYISIDAFGLAGLFDTPTLVSTWWYMSAAIFYVVAIPLVAFIKKNTCWITVILGCVAFPRLLNVGYPGGVNPYTFLLPMLFGMMFFDLDLFGRFNLSKRVKMIHRKNSDEAIGMILNTPPLFIISIIIIVISAKVFQTIDFWDMWELEYGLIPVLIVVLLKYTVISIPGISSILSFLGRHSMTVFLTHSFIRGIYLEDLVYSNGNFLLNYAVLLVLSFALAVVIDWFKELIGFKRLTATICNAIANNK